MVPVGLGGADALPRWCPSNRSATCNLSLAAAPPPARIGAGSSAAAPPWRASSSHQRRPAAAGAAAAGGAGQPAAPPPRAPPPPPAAPGAAGAGGSGGGSPEYWQELLGLPTPEMFGPRARSASDAAVLRRKGHLKEQDSFISFLLSMHQTHTSLEVMQKVERWIDEHRRDARGSRLRCAVPRVGRFFTPLRLADAFAEYDEFFALSRRRYVPPNFAELRHILNIAQVRAVAAALRLVTFDADGTLYADGAHMEHDCAMVDAIVALMRAGVHVAIVTAAGYPGAPERFEQRVEGLLAAFRALKLPDAVTRRFHIMGGECNYLLRVAPGGGGRLEFVPDAEWKSAEMRSWAPADIAALLADAEALLLQGAARLRLPVAVVRKERAVGVVPEAPTIYEVLEELAISVRVGLEDLAAARGAAGGAPPVPFCAFNGGADVFVDVGNKSLGIEALMAHVGAAPEATLHVGDRFTESGNDSATRDCCSILWVANPEETHFFMTMLLSDVKRVREQPYIE